MKKSIVLALILAFVGAGQVKAQLITGFGSSDLNPVNLATDFQAPWTSALASQNATSLTVTGEPALGGGGIVSNLANDVTLIDDPAGLKLVLTGALTAATPANFFQITLYDNTADLNSITYTFNWNEWTTVGVTQSVVASSPIVSGDFDGVVSAWGISVGGGPTDTASFRFDNLEAVPEPSTYAMLVVGLGALFFFGRRRKMVKVRA